MKNQIASLWITAILCCLTFIAYGQTTYYSRQNGAWNNPATWSTDNHLGIAASQIPGSNSTDIVIIAAGHVVDYNAFANSGNSAIVAALTIGTADGAGTLRFPFSNYNGGANGNLDRLNNNSGYTLTVSGDVVIATNGSILSVEGGSGSPLMSGTARNEDHFLNIQGNLSNTGTIDLEGSSNAQRVDLSFIGSNNQIISGEGIWDTYSIIYNNTGSHPNNQIENQSVSFTNSVEAGRSSFIQGTYVHNNSVTYRNQGLSNDGSDYTNVSFDIRDGVFNMVEETDTDPIVVLTNGNISITGGQFNGGHGGVGSGNATNLTVDGNITVSGTGILNIGDGNPATATTPTDGTLTISGSASTLNATTLYTHDLTLNAGANLQIENGAICSIGNSLNNTGDLILDGISGNGSSLSTAGSSTQLTVYNRLFIQEECSFVQNSGTVEVTPNFTTGGDPESIQIEGVNASYTMLDGALNVMTSITEANVDAIILEAENASMDIQGGMVTLGNTASGRGRLRFRQAASETTNFTASGSASITVADAIQRNTAGSIANITLSDNATLLVGTDNSSGNVSVFFHEGTLTINDNAIARFGSFGDLQDIVISGSGTLETGTTGVSGRVDINGSFNYSSPTASCTFYSGMDIEAGASVNISGGVIDILPDLTSVADTRLQIRGELLMNGGVINLGASVTDITNGNLLQVYDGGTLTINAGTFNMLSSPSLTSLANRNPFNITNDDAGEDATRGDGTVNIGDGTGGANTARLIIAPNLAAELPAPSTRDIFDMDGANSVLTINTDGYLQVGGGNIGNLRLNTSGARFLMNGGTCDITASLTLDNGTELHMNGGVLNVGTGDSNGANRFIFAGNPTEPTRVLLNGGTINVGDGNSDFVVGNSNNNPSFGNAAFQSLEISGGTFNLNGSFQLDDANARFIMSGGNFNINPRGAQNTPADENVCYFRRGIVDFSSGQITIINPHEGSGAGYGLNINDQGNPDSGDRISGLPSGTTPNSANFSGTFRFGNGSSALSGSVDGFDLLLSTTHTYGSFIINNPSGTNRQVELVNGSKDLQMNGNLILFAGTFDINDNTLNRNAVGGALTINPAGHLIIGNNNGAHHFPGNATPFSSYSLGVGSTVTYDGDGDAAVSLPGTAQFSNLTILGTGSKTLTTPETVRSTLTLEGSTFVSGSNLTMASGSTLLRNGTDLAGIMTGNVQGSHAYTIAYQGLYKTTQNPEWSGSGAKSFTIAVDPDQTLTLHTPLTVEGTFSLNSGTFLDNAHTLTIQGNVSNSALHTGTGKILLSGSAATRTIGGNGNGIFQNLELNDTRGANFTAAQTINGSLMLSDGVLNVDNHALNLGVSATVAGTFSSSNMIQVNSGAGAAGVVKAYSGAETFTWPVGSNSKYTPVTIQVINTTAGGSITVNPVDAENPFTTDAGNFSLDYYWIVSRTGFGSETANLSFTYDQSDADGRGNEAGYVPARYSPTSWTNLNNVALVDETNNVISFNNVTYINGQFTAAEPSEFGTVLTYYSRADGNWNTASSWSTTSLGGTAALTIPGSSTPVIIGNNNTITVGSSNTNAPSVEIQETGTLEIADATSGHNFGTVSGTGTLRIMTDDTDATPFPAGTYTDLLSTSGGTVEYSGSGSYTALNTPSSFHNLTVSGSGIVTLPDTHLNIEGDLSINGNVTTLVSNSVHGDLNVAGILTTTVGATLRLRSGAARTIIVGADIINEGTFHTNGGGVSAHALSIAGNLTNNGVFDMASTANHYCNVTFSGAEDAVVSGSGSTTDFYRIILNKGTSWDSALEITASNFSLSAPTNTVNKALELQNGTLILSAPHSLTLSTGGGQFFIPATAGLWINDAGATAEITSSSSNLSLAGLLRLTEGSINIGDDVSGTEFNAIYYTEGNATINVEAGTLTVGGEIRPNPASATLSYSQSGGIVRLANNRSSTESINNDFEADFCIETGAGSNFTMSGGLLEIIRRNAGGDGKAIRINSGISHAVSGGTVRILNSSTLTNFDVGITSAAPFWNLEIGDGNSFTERVGASNGGEQDLTVLNDLTINLVGGTFKLYQANATTSTNHDIDLNLGGNFILLNGSFASGEPSIVTFNGSGLAGQSSPQTVSGSLTFYSVNVNHTNGSGSVQLTSDIRVQGNWTYTAGTFEQNEQLITFDGAVNQVIGGNPFSFDDLMLNNAAGLSLSASQMTVNGDLSLTEGILNLGANQLSFGATATVSTPTAFDNSRMIITNGQEAALGIEKAYTGNTSFLFPMGTATKYTPANLELTNHGSSGDGMIRINPVASRNPLSPLGKALNYYWNVETTDFGAAPEITHNYTYDESDVAGTELSYVDAYYDGTDWQTGVDTNVDEGTNVISVSTNEALDQFAFTAGYDFSPPIIYYSRSSGDWNVNTTWSTDPSGTPVAGLPPASDNPVIIQSGHTVTIPISTSVSAANTTIENTAVLEIQEPDASNYAIGTVGGSGTLRFSVGTTPSLPILSNGFVNAGGGTVEYEYSANAPLPTEPSAYHHLIISGTRVYYLSADYTIRGDLAITTTNRLEDNGFSINGLADGTFTLANGSEFRVEGTNTFPAGFGIYDLQLGSEVRYRSNSSQIVADLGSYAYHDLTLESNGIKTLEGDIFVNGDLSILTGATLDASNYDISLRGNWRRNPANNSVFIPGASTVTFNSGGAQLIDLITGGSEEEIFYNVVIANGTALSLDPTETYQTTALNVTDNLIISSGTLDLRNKPLTLSGNLTNNSSTASPIINASNISFDNTLANQTIGGSNSLVLEDITLEKASGTTLILDTLLTINGTLDWSNDGTITMVSDNLSFGPSSAINGSFGINRMIVTAGTADGPEVIKQGNTTADSYDFTFPLGVSGSYTPVAVDATAISGNGSVGVRSVTGNNNGNFTLLEPGRAIDRYFTFNLNGISSLTAALDFSYADADVQGSEINYLSWVYEGSPITAEASNGFVTAAANTFGSTDITITNPATEWIAAEAGAFFPKLYSVVASGDWNLPTSWNTVADGSGSAAVPTQYNDVEIQSGDIITVSTNSSVASLQLDGQLEITDAASAYNLGVLTGSGKLTLNSGELPAYNALGATFFDNGTVEYAGGGNYSLPASRTQYRNLVISGGGIKTMSTNITVLNDLTIDAAILDANNTNNYNLSLGGSLNLQNSGGFEPRNGEFALIGSSAQSVPTGISFNNLRFDNVGTKSISTAGSFAVNNFRILASSGQVSFSSSTDIDLSGNWSNAAGATAYINVASLTLNGSANQSIAGTNVFHNLNVNKSGIGHTVTTVGTITLNDGSNGGSLTISADEVVSGSANYNLLGNWNNSGTFTTTGTVNFNGSLAQNISGDNTFGSLIIDNASGVSMADDITTTISSDFTVSSGTPLNTGGGTATIVFDGAGEQSINGSVTFNNLSKLSGDTLTLSGSSVVNGNLTLTDGIINTTNSDMLTIGADGAILGGSTDSYINGPLSHLENSTAANVKRFPLGNNGVYRPITLNLAQADATERSYTAVLNEGAPLSRTLPATPEELVRVSGLRYYTITQSPSAAVSSATVTIDYNADDLVDDGPSLRIAKSDGAGNWVNIGGTGNNPDPATPGVFAGGSITSGTFTTFSDFVLASSSTPNNPLPIELLHFGGQADEEEIRLHWATAWEDNNDYFEIERSADGKTFMSIGKVAGAGNSTTEQQYQFVDRNPLLGSAYYRLRQTDFDGKYTHSKIVLLNFYPEAEYYASISPNPVEGGRTVLQLVGVKAATVVQVSLVHTSGKIICQMKWNADHRGIIEKEISGLDHLASGIYSLLLTSDYFSDSLKLIIP